MCFDRANSLGVFVLFVALFMALAASVKAADDTYQFSDEQSRQRFLELTETLRCPKCQNQNIADSDAMIAHDMRRKVYQLVSQGQSNEQVIDFMKSRYGDFVYYKPPVTPLTSMLWLIPILFIVIAAFAFVMIRIKTTSSLSEAKSTDKADMLEQANSLLEKE